jgi:hypothetical protein
VLFRVLPVQGRREEQVQSQFECIVDHSGDHSFQSSRGGLKARISVDLDKPRLEILVNHEIESKYFEGGRCVPLAEQWIGGLDGIGGDAFQLRQYQFSEAQMFVCVVEIFLEVVVAEFVAVLVLAVLVGVDLYGVVGEMDELVLGVAQLKFVAAGSDVALLVPVTLRLAVLR